MVGTLPEMVRTIVLKDFTQYCPSPPLCTMISYGYTLSLKRIFCHQVITNNDQSEILFHLLLQSTFLNLAAWRINQFRFSIVII